MSYNSAADSFCTKQLCSRLSSQNADFYTRIGHFAFGGLEAAYDVHLRLIRKCIVDFLLVIFELFSLGFTAEELQANIDSKSPF